MMKIDKLIDKDYRSVSILEEMHEISEWLKEAPYFVVIDEESCVAGIVTLKDVHYHPLHSIIDCDIKKPRVKSEESVETVFEIMQKAKTDFLPVYKDDSFEGVISLITLTDYLIKTIKTN